MSPQAKALFVVFSILLIALPLHAQDSTQETTQEGAQEGDSAGQDPADSGFSEEIIVTGTRKAGLVPTETRKPVTGGTD